MPGPGLIAAALPSVVSGLASWFGGHSANRTNVKLARERMGFEHAEAGRQMEFQERMSSTAYQRAMLDMRQAGLNPMLAYAQGGASSPAGAAGAGAQAEVSDVVSPAVASALQAATWRKQMKQMDEDRRLTVQRQWTEEQVRAHYRSQVDLNAASADLAREQLAMLKLQLPALQNSARVESSNIGKYGAYVDRLLKSLGGPLSLLGGGLILKGVRGASALKGARRLGSYIR